MRRAFLVWLLLCGTAWSQKISDLPVITAEDIGTDANIRFGLDNTGDNTSYQLSLAELKKVGVQVINVLQYGADPTGVSDSTTSIASALNAAEAADAVLYVPSGTYDLATWTTRTTTGTVIIIGDGRSVTTFTGPGSSQHFLLLTAGHSCLLRDIAIADFSSAVRFEANPVTAHDIVDIERCSFSNCPVLSDVTVSSTEVVNRLIIRSCEITASTNGVMCRGTDIKYADISNNRITLLSSATNGFAAIWLSNTAWQSNAMFVVSGNLIDGVANTVGTNNAVYGIICFGENVKIVNNHVANVSNADDSDEVYGIYVKSDGGIIANNTLLDAGSDTAIAVKADIGTSTVANVTVSHNRIHWTTPITKAIKGIDCNRPYVTIDSNIISGVSSAIELDGSGSATITNNIIHDTDMGASGAISTGHGGIHVQDASNVLISGNVLTDLDTQRDASLCGIKIVSALSNVDNVVISDNTIDTITSVITSTIGIFAEAKTGTTISNVKIDGNTIDNMTIGIRPLESGTFESIVIRDNALRNISTTLVHTDIGNVGNVSIGGNTVNGSRVVTATANDATPTVIVTDYLVTANTAATTITALDNGVQSQTVLVLINDANTTVDFTGTTLKGNNGADWTPASGDHMTCTKIGSNWYCDISEN